MCIWIQGINSDVFSSLASLKALQEAESQPELHQVLQSYIDRSVVIVIKFVIKEKSPWKSL